jgi:sugar/nucleoside kinase (ribokinase family)
VSELDLLVLGDVNPDVIVGGPDLQARFGQVEQLVDRASLVVGGSATITAIGAGRLGLSVGLCGVVGDDDVGWFMTNRLAEARVDVSHLRRDASTPTGMSVVLDRGDDRAIFTALGTIAALGPDDLAALPDRPARHVHVASYYLMSDGFRQALPSALRRFRAAGAGTSVDTNWDPAGRWELADLLAETDVFLPNLNELMAVTGAAALRDALDDPRLDGRDVVVKRGERGAAARLSGVLLSVGAVAPATFGDAVGAGDSFNAGYLAGRLTGADPERSLRLAVATGTLSTRGVGGTAAQPDRSEAESWAARLSPSADLEGDFRD